MLSFSFLLVVICHWWSLSIIVVIYFGFYLGYICQGQVKVLVIHHGVFGIHLFWSVVGGQNLFQSELKEDKLKK